MKLKEYRRFYLLLVVARTCILVSRVDSDSIREHLSPPLSRRSWAIATYRRILKITSRFLFIIPRTRYFVSLQAMHSFTQSWISTFQIRYSHSCRALVHVSQLTLQVLLSDFASGMPCQRVSGYHHLGAVYSQIDLCELRWNLQWLRERDVPEHFAHLLTHASEYIIKQRWLPFNRGQYH